MPTDVGVFTDTYLPTVNGTTYTIRTWRDYWKRETDGRMNIVYPNAPEYDPDPSEHPVPSVRFPFYDGYRVGVPQLPTAVRDVDIIHVHSPCGLGLAALRLARRTDLPLVASYHTPLGEYTDYVVSHPGIRRIAGHVVERYERWFYRHADLVLVPSTTTKQHLTDRLAIDTPIRVLSNGIDTELFQPCAPDTFRVRYDLPPDQPLIGYTGRHGYEKRLTDIVEAAAGLDRDVTVVFGGDGPARETVQETAGSCDVDVRFLGFLDREELPQFYSAIDVFAFPSPVETQGLVALEANACGTPVVGADDGALSETIQDGETGYRVPTGDIEAFTAALEQALMERDRLSEACLAHRSEMGVSHTIDRLNDLYTSVMTTGSIER